MPDQPDPVTIEMWSWRSVIIALDPGSHTVTYAELLEPGEHIESVRRLNQAGIEVLIGRQWAQEVEVEADAES